MTERAELGTSSGPVTPFHEAMLEVLTRIADGEASRNVWNEDPPIVWGIDKTLSPLGMASLTAWEMPLVDEVWIHRDTAQVIARLAESLGRAMEAAETGLDSARRRVCAVALSAEAWVLDIPEEASMAEREAARRFAARLGVADHPWGAEAKSVIGVSADGWRYTVSRLRRTGDGPSWAEPPDGGVSGRYVEALDTLLAAMRTTR